MATIKCLPQELIIKILEQTVEPNEEEERVDDEQRRLDKMVKATSPGLHRTEKLYVGRLSIEKAAAVLSHLRKVEFLTLEQTIIIPDFFVSPALNDFHRDNFIAVLTDFYNSCGHLDRLTLSPDVDLVNALLSSTIQVSQMTFTTFGYGGIGLSNDLVRIVLRLVVETKVLEGGSLELDGYERGEMPSNWHELEVGCKAKGVKIVGLEEEK
ncbi:arylformamidase [Pseudohyphozyma bogoriensis]|nr:arylformamidase [Pseudohyphozyma bogoriensis]